MRFFIEDAEAASIKGFLEDDWSESERIDQDHEIIFNILFNRLESGKIDYFKQETATHLILWTRSPRNGVKVQESHAWKLNGEIIPLSHQNINSPKEIIKNCEYMTDLYIYEGRANS